MGDATMYRKQFGIVAETLRSSRAPRRTIFAFDNALKGTNPRFSESKFLSASGLKLSKKGKWY